MMVSINHNGLTEKILAGERITPEEALLLYEWPLEELGALADQRRRQAKRSSYKGDGNEIVTYIVDRNINTPTSATFIVSSARFIARKKMTITTSFHWNSSIRSWTNFPPWAVFKF